MQRAVLVLLLIAVALVAAALAGPWDPQTRPASPAPAPPPEEALPTVPPPRDPLQETLRELDVQPWDLTWLGLVLLTLLVVGIGFLLLRWWHNRPPVLEDEGPDEDGPDPGDVVGAPPVQPHLPTLLDGLDDADARLRAALSAQDAVIAAWVALEEAAARSGVARDPAATPTEFTVEVLDHTPADRAATRRLLGLYLRARFGEERMTADDVGVATAAVRTLVDTLAAGRDRAAEDDTAAQGGDTSEGDGATGDDTTGGPR